MLSVASARPSSELVQKSAIPLQNGDPTTQSSPRRLPSRNRIRERDQSVDSSAEIRYLVLPERPRGTERMTEAQLASIVTRESMIGVGQLAGKKKNRNG